ncbi:uncharacterized protein LOC117830764 [Xyrichtys novacula]|uniref:Uncharacterized protein LOC117830764 n=1 Tax=Xyrichtys novacula TaxID=13765 RepID=A0AAV1F304_XYRNO|nr:uncharacterized protein LOC117830764 [Xyrichtys novacula]
MPKAQQYITSSKTQDDLSPDVFRVSEERIHTLLGDSIAQTFSEIFQVQGQACIFLDNLSQLVTEEVALKVNFILSVAIKTPVSSLQKQAFFVSSTISCISTLDDMVVCTAGILSQCFAELDSKLKQHLCLEGFSKKTIMESVDEDKPKAEAEPHEEMLEIVVPFHMSNSPHEPQEEFASGLPTSSVEDIYLDQDLPETQKSTVSSLRVFKEKLMSDSFVYADSKAVSSVLAKKFMNSNKSGSSCTENASETSKKR